MKTQLKGVELFLLIDYFNSEIKDKAELRRRGLSGMPSLFLLNTFKHVLP